jgi:hypothetical protein
MGWWLWRWWWMAGWGVSAKIAEDSAVILGAPQQRNEAAGIFGIEVDDALEIAEQIGA